VNLFRRGAAASAFVICCRSAFSECCRRPFEVMFKFSVGLVSWSRLCRVCKGSATECHLPHVENSELHACRRIAVCPQCDEPLSLDILRSLEAKGNFRMCPPPSHCAVNLWLGSLSKVCFAKIGKGGTRLAAQKPSPSPLPNTRKKCML
jgi:hypothetical protein